MFTLDEIVSLLRSLAESEPEVELARLRSSFSKLGIMLDHDLPMVLDDILPPLRRLSKLLPDSLEEG
jgi:hypothetical protein